MLLTPASEALSFMHLFGKYLSTASPHVLSWKARVRPGALFHQGREAGKEAKSFTAVLCFNSARTADLKMMC